MTRTICLLLCSMLWTTAGSVYAQETFINAQNQFALTFYHQIRTDSSNVFISPLSINIALAIAMEGAEGETREELSTLLGLKHITNVSTAYSTLISRFKKDALRRSSFHINGLPNKETYISISNALWHNTEFSIEPAYLEKVQSDYEAEVIGYNHSDISTIQSRINGWISEKTNNKIPSLPASIDEQTNAVILNATYLMAPWGEEFDKDLTEKREFTSLDHTSKDIEFMYGRRFTFYYEDNDIQAVSIPYAGGVTVLSMLVVLPNKTYGLPDIEKKLDIAYYNTIAHSLTYADVKLYMPKYRIESELSLAAPLQDLGVRQAFSPTANFSQMNPNKKFSLGTIIHKTFIEIDEEKTEAAAVIDGFVVGAADPGTVPTQTVDIDHPFLFFIIDEQTKEILFMGKHLHAQ